MKTILLTLLGLFTLGGLQAQKYKTSSAALTFFSNASLEDITAKSSSASAALDASTGEMAFSVDITSFTFENPTMQSHFNENYMESGTYPKSTFAGKLSDLSAVDFSTDGTYTVSVTGKLTIHGVTKSVTTTGKLIVKGSIVTASCIFNIKLADYGIVNDKSDSIAEEIKITVSAAMIKKE